MSITINTNSAATTAAYNLSTTNSNLQRSLNRLSSGSRINSSFDDAGGLAVSMKLSAAIRRNDATKANVGNALSFLQTQDGIFKTADKVLSRMSELAALARDVSKNSADISNYSTEFLQLSSQLSSLRDEKFNGVALFSGANSNFDPNNDTGKSITVITSEDGTQSCGITQAAINADPWMNMMVNGFARTSWPTTGDYFYPNYPGKYNGTQTGYPPGTGYGYSLDGTKNIVSPSEQWAVVNIRDGQIYPGSDAIAVSIYNSYKNQSSPQGELTSDNAANWVTISQMAIKSLATMRAQNGAEQSRLTFSQDMLETNKVNLEAANSRIIDVDVAAESSQLARFNVLQQAGTAMLAQANQSFQSILRLISQN
jgi:flagellin-like hook-associated protein FlgL